MKRMKLYAPLALLALGLSTAAFGQTDWNVSTDVQKRKVLLEEYTGIYCGWCPEGHKVANQLLSGMNGDAYAVNIHTGYYANPNKGNPDYRTDAGEEIATVFAADGYPSGMVNRQAFDGQTVFGRNRWVDLANTVHEDDAPVNLYLQSQYDGNTGVLTVHVEGYYTADATTLGTQTLSVLWTQDDIIGVQNSGGNDYHHNHMLRDYISPVWGDTIATVTAGSYFSKDYTYTLPTAIKDIDVVPGDIHVIAFVTADKANVENVVGARPAFVNYKETEDAQTSEPEIAVGARYGFNFFETEVKNLCTKTATSATFDVTVNGETTTQTVDCLIEPFEKAIVKVPAKLNYAASGKTKYSVGLTAINGVAVEAEPMTGSFQKPTVCGTTSIVVDIETDYYASQNTYMLKNADGDTLEIYGPYADDVITQVEETITGLEDGQTYCFECYDTYGNGVQGSHKGHIIIHSATGKLVAQEYTISGYGSRSFFTIDTSTGISDITADTTGSATYYTLSGQTTSQPRGLVIERKGGKAKVVIKK